MGVSEEADALMKVSKLFDMAKTSIVSSLSMRMVMLVGFTQLSSVSLLMLMSPVGKLVLKSLVPTLMLIFFVAMLMLPAGVTVGRIESDLAVFEVELGGFKAELREFEVELGGFEAVVSCSFI